MEGYERMKAGMRLYRHGSDQDAQPFSNISTLYDVADAAMPLHDSIHHDGWVGDNPKGYKLAGFLIILVSKRAGKIQPANVFHKIARFERVMYLPGEAQHLDNAWRLAN